MDAMSQNGTLDKAAAATLPTVTGTPSFPTDAQQSQAKQVVAQGWAKAISG
jgi:putative spermidine/putrescine transport system substrate-binding protein